MYGAAVGARTGGATPRGVLTNGANVVVAAIVVATVVLHVVWLIRFRRGYVTEWDESGYLQFALSNFDALHDEGLWTFAKTVGGRDTFGPLLPFVTSLLYPIVGRGVFGSLLVLPLFYGALVAASYGLARRLVPAAWAVVAAFSVAAVPAVIDYTRLFHFALPATACMTAALWALVRSDGLRNARWAIAFGLFVGLMLLSRTVTVAFAPGLVLASGVQLFVTPFRLWLRNILVAAAAALAVAGPWYLVNARSVYDNLVATGYGEAAAQYGRDYPVASWGFWTKELRLDLSYLWLPLAAILFLCFATAVTYYVLHTRGLRPSRPHSIKTASVLALVIVVIEGYLALTSSRNEGTAFALPWLPALVVLAVAAAASIPTRAIRAGLASLLVVAGLAAVLSKSGWVPPLAAMRNASVPGLGEVVMTDGRGLIQDEVQGDGYDIGPVTEPLPDIHRGWLPLAEDVMGWSLQHAEQRGEPLNLMLGMDDRIFGNSRLILAAQLRYQRFQLVDYLHPFPDGDTVASYRHQLLFPKRVNAIITGAPPVNGSTVSRSRAEAAARSLGFARERSFTMPDGRTIWIWWRERASP
jgi:hypothetical protein